MKIKCPLFCLGKVKKTDMPLNKETGLLLLVDEKNTLPTVNESHSF